MWGRALLGTGALVLAVGLAACTSDPSPARDASRSNGSASASPQARVTAAAPLPDWDRAAAAGRVDDLVDAEGSSWSALHTVLVSQDGELQLERHYGGRSDAPQDVSTVTATVVGTLAGIAVRQGQLALEDRLVSMLPDHGADMSPLVGSITLRQLLTMQSGLPADLRRDTRPWFASAPDWATAILGHGLSGAPTEFSYTTANAQLVGEAVHEATGTSLSEYAERTLFRPLGITRQVSWPVRRATDEDVAFGGLALDARELLALGQLYLDGGDVDGRRVLSPSWVRAATQDQQFALDPGGYGYGYLWWVRDFNGFTTYAALGEGQQLLEVVPDLGLVVVALGDLDPSLGLDGASLQAVLNTALLPDGP